MTNENRCEPGAGSANYVVHVPDDAGGIQWRGARYRLSALTPPAIVAALVAERDALLAEKAAYESPAWEANERLNAQVFALHNTVAALVEALEGAGKFIADYEGMVGLHSSVGVSIRAALALYREVG